VHWTTGQIPVGAVGHKDTLLEGTREAIELVEDGDGFYRRLKRTPLTLADNHFNSW
jgi:hypothetical protein